MRNSALALGTLTATAVLCLTGCSSDQDSGSDEASNWPDSITVSLVPSTEGEDLAEALEPLTNYLSENLGIEVNGVVANDYAATVEAIGANQAQVAITDAGSLYNAMTQHNAELILRDVRFGATSYASVAFTNDPDKYCEEEPVMATYEAEDTEFAYCNGIENAGATATGQGPAATGAFDNLEPGTAVAFQAATSPAGYQYPIVALEDEDVDVDSLSQVPVQGNNNAMLAVLRGDAEVGFGFWDARSSILAEAPEAATELVAFAYTEMIPNGGVVVTEDLPEDLKTQLADLMDSYAESSDEAKQVMQDLVGLTDWTKETNEEEIERYGEIYTRFSS
ncbi:phosphate/phosphite/phosphonate ABC transporter substrate-binding protein [Corynebacterium auris]|uniref:phosphate/phosphite/phosphonate ABC transporter substrate-binding protein n=1 Tax=Corynebacterium auris TaxID=44750 RepID=UPI0025B4061C|nr:phosphate/phosphite/phosphonate ABC transporter substrate-binding protein [Corynebacterium auris]WJY67644.1 Phosphate-import protein PhnD precursor [Corynebacterium auris]